MLQVLGILFIVYLFAFANGLMLVALDRTFGRTEKRRGTPAELPDVELAGSESLSCRLSAPGLAVRAFFRDLPNRPSPHQR